MVNFQNEINEKTVKKFKNGKQLRIKNFKKIHEEI